MSLVKCWVARLLCSAALRSALSVGERSNFKIFLRTRKIMVMHSNERGEYDLRTLVDRNGSDDTT